jgi:hypothetical protein
MSNDGDGYRVKFGMTEKIKYDWLPCQARYDEAKTV